jgi:cyanophycinase-like exopeptidase
VDELLFRGEESPVLKALTAAWRHGATVVACSGGAAALSPLMIAGGSSGEALRYGVASDASHPGLLVEPGLGLFEAGILDQNMLGSGRLGRLIVACAEEAVPVGFGLCEDSGLVVEPDRGMRVIGRHGVIVVEVDQKGVSYGDDLLAVRGVGLSVVAPESRIGSAAKQETIQPRAAGAANGALTIQTLVGGLERGLAALETTGRVPSGRSRVRIRLREVVAGRSGRLDIESHRLD